MQDHERTARAGGASGSGDAGRGMPPTPRRPAPLSMDGVQDAADAFYVSARSGASSSENEKGDSERRLTPRTPTDHALLHHGSFRGKLAKKIEAVYGPFVNVDASEIGPVLAPFLPHGVLQHAMTAETLAPTGHRVPGVILLADISGFTRMCEQFAGGGASLASLIKESRSSSGAVSTDGFASARYRINNTAEAQGVGAEGVRNVLNIYFRRLIEIIEDFQGDVLRIAGDALIVMFSSADESLRALADKACNCAFACVAAIHEMPSPGEVPITLHAAIGAGELRVFHVGSGCSTWQMVVCGEPFKQVGATLDDAGPGEVAVSNEVWELLRTNDWSHKSSRSVNSVVLNQPKKFYIHGDTAHPDYVAPPSARKEIIETLRKAPIAERTATIIRSYTPVPVCAGVAAERTGLLAEICRATVMFINIQYELTDDSIHHGNGVNDLQRLQNIFSRAEYSIVHYKGYIKELTVDDKGMVLVAGFGINPLIVRSSAINAVLSALKVESLLDEIDCVCYIGIATGPVFCASLGSKTRKEFAMVGDTVNVAARISGAARKGNLKFKESSNENNADSKFRQFFARARRRNSEAVLPNSLPLPAAQRHAAHALSTGTLPIPERIREVDEESTSSVGTTTTNTNSEKVSEVRTSNHRVSDSRASDLSMVDVEHVNSNGYFDEDEEDEVAIRLTDITEEQSDLPSAHEHAAAAGLTDRKLTSDAEGLARKESLRLFRQRSRFEKFSKRVPHKDSAARQADVVHSLRIAVDEDTYFDSVNCSKLSYTSYLPVNLKGKSKPVQTFAPGSVRATKPSPVIPPIHPSSTLRSKPLVAVAEDGALDAPMSAGPAVKMHVPPLSLHRSSSARGITEHSPSRIGPATRTRSTDVAATQVARRFSVLAGPPDLNNSRSASAGSRSGSKSKSKPSRRTHDKDRGHKSNFSIVDVVLGLHKLGDDGRHSVASIDSYDTDEPLRDAEYGELTIIQLLQLPPVSSANSEYATRPTWDDQQPELRRASTTQHPPDHTNERRRSAQSSDNPRRGSAGTSTSDASGHEYQPDGHDGGHRSSISSIFQKIGKRRTSYADSPSNTDSQAGTPMSRMIAKLVGKAPNKDDELSLPRNMSSNTTNSQPEQAAQKDEQDDSTFYRRRSSEISLDDGMVKSQHEIKVIREPPSPVTSGSPPLEDKTALLKLFPTVSPGSTTRKRLFSKSAVDRSPVMSPSTSRADPNNTRASFSYSSSAMTPRPSSVRLLCDAPGSPLAQTKSGVTRRSSLAVVTGVQSSSVSKPFFATKRNRSSHSRQRRATASVLPPDLLHTGEILPEEITPMSYPAFQLILPLIFGARRVEQQVEDILWARSRGVPLYLRELSIHFITEEFGFIEDDIWRLRNNDFAAILTIGSEVPTSLSRVFRERFSLLSTPQQTILKVMSTIGDRVSVAIISDMIMMVKPLRVYWDTTMNRDSTEELLTPVTEDAQHADNLLHARYHEGGTHASCTEHHTYYQSVKTVVVEMSLQGLLDFNEASDVAECREVLFLETISTSVPFQLRQAMHTTVCKMLAASTTLEWRMRSLPSLVHHLNMRFNEERAGANLRLLQVFGGDYLDRWIVGQVIGFLGSDSRRFSDGPLDDRVLSQDSPLLSRNSSLHSGRSALTSIGEGEDDGDAPPEDGCEITACATFGSLQSLLGHSIGQQDVSSQDVFRALSVLPALPWLRGLAKAIRGVQVSGLVNAAVNSIRKQLLKQQQPQPQRSREEAHRHRRTESWRTEMRATQLEAREKKPVVLDYRAAKKYIMDLQIESHANYPALTSPVSNRYHAPSFAFADSKHPPTPDQAVRPIINRNQSHEMWDRARANTLAGDSF